MKNLKPIGTDNTGLATMFRELQRGLNFSRRHIEDFFIFRQILDQRYKYKLFKYSERPAPLNSNNLHLIETLQKDGVVITSLNELGESSQSLFFKQAQELKRLLALKPVNKERGLPFLLPSPAQVTQHLETFLWGLDQRLLAIVENYLKLPAAYHGMYFHRDLMNTPPTKSKLWHRDMEDYRSLKIIVYLNDVYDETYGPLQYIPKGVSEKIAKKLNYKYGYVEDSIMEKVAPDITWKSCLGAAGTTILMDTANLFHRGKVPSASDRFAIFFDYTSRYPKRPYYCKSSLPYGTLKSIAEELSSYQKNCLLWR